MSRKISPFLRSTSRSFHASSSSSSSIQKQAIVTKTKRTHPRNVSPVPYQDSYEEPIQQNPTKPISTSIHSQHHPSFLNFHQKSNETNWVSNSSPDISTNKSSRTFPFPDPSTPTSTSQKNISKHTVLTLPRVQSCQISVSPSQNSKATPSMNISILSAHKPPNPGSLWQNTSLPLNYLLNPTALSPSSPDGQNTPSARTVPVTPNPSTFPLMMAIPNRCWSLTSKPCQPIPSSPSWPVRRPRMLGIHGYPLGYLMNP